MFGLSPTTALTGTALAPAAPAGNALSQTSQVALPAGALQPPAAAYPAGPVAPAAQPKSLPKSQPKSQASTPGRPAAQSPATAPDKAPDKATEGHPASSSTDACAGVQTAADTFLMHMNAAHLEASPGQQVADALAVDQYVKTHTVLIANMIKPLVSGSDDALGVFLQHVYAAHLEASPGQQVADALAVDQYVKTHTVLIEHMLKPLAGTDTSSC